MQSHIVIGYENVHNLTPTKFFFFSVSQISSKVNFWREKKKRKKKIKKIKKGKRKEKAYFETYRMKIEERGNVRQPPQNRGGGSNGGRGRWSCVVGCCALTEQRGRARWREQCFIADSCINIH